MQSFSAGWYVGMSNVWCVSFALQYIDQKPLTLVPGGVDSNAHLIPARTARQPLCHSKEPPSDLVRWRATLLIDIRYIVEVCREETQKCFRHFLSHRRVAFGDPFLTFRSSRNRCELIQFPQLDEFLRDVALHTSLVYLETSAWRLLGS